MSQQEIPQNLNPHYILHWYALHVCSRHERRVAEYLAANPIEFFLPTYRAVHRWKNGCRMELDLPLFPGYMFVRIPLADRLRIERCPGVVGLVGFSDRPFALDDSEVESLKSGLKQCPAEPYPLLAVGTQVRVRSGPFGGMEGTLVRKKKDFRVVLSMNVIAKSIAVELDLCNLEPLPVRRTVPHFSEQSSSWIDNRIR
jgi:transcription antitermination factor NusG